MNDVVNSLLQNRRSVFPKEYTGERVEDSLIRQLLENANWAPTHKLTEPWRFVVFTGSGIERLASFQSELYKKVTSAKGTFDPERFEILRDKPRLSSHIIAVGMKRDEKKSIPEIEEVGAVFCAIQNIYLTASANKIGCYLSTGGITFYPEAKAFFGLGEEDKLLGFMHIGIPKHHNQKSNRRSIEEKVRWER